MSLAGITIRPATAADLPAIVRLLADDELGRAREAPTDPLPPSYHTAFQAVAADPHNELVVVEYAGVVVGTLQLTFIPGLSYQGAWRAQIEAVRVDAGLRGRGLGAQLMSWAVERARERGCRFVQLTSNLRRRDAHRFYERLGFVGSHLGMKLEITQ